MKNSKKTNLTASETPQTAEKPETTQLDPENNTQLQPNLQEVKSRWWLPYVITFAVLAVMVVLVGWARGGFAQTDTKTLLGEWCDAFFVPGILGVCFGLLVVGSNGGAFDMLSYGMRRLFALFKRDPVDRKYATFYEYQQARKAKKRSFWYLIIVGAIYIALAVALFVAYELV